MVRLKLPYGKSRIEADIPDSSLLAVLGPKGLRAERSGKKEVSWQSIIPSVPQELRISQ